MLRGLPANSGDVSAVDIDGDGLFEIRIGGSTATEYFLEYNRFEDGDLRPVGQFVIGAKSAVACADLDGDGLNEILQGSIDVETNSWTIITHKIEDLRYVEIEQQSAQLVATPEPGPPTSPSEAQHVELRQELDRLSGNNADQPTCI